MTDPTASNRLPIGRLPNTALPVSFQALGRQVAVALVAPFVLTTSAVGRPTSTPAPRATVTPTATAPSLSVGRPVPLRTTDLVKVQGGYYVEFPNGPPAVVIEYETNIPMSNMNALTAEADKLIKVFQADLQTAGVSTAVLRAIHFDNSGSVRNGNGYGFIYVKNTAGLWVRDQDQGR